MSTVKIYFKKMICVNKSDFYLYWTHQINSGGHPIILFKSENVTIKLATTVRQHCDLRYQLSSEHLHSNFSASIAHKI